MKKIAIIKSSNIADYNRFHWWFMLAFVILGSAFLWMLFKMSWLILFVLISLVITLQRLFRIEIRLQADKITIIKSFFGIPYFYIGQPFIQILFHEDSQRLIFQQSSSNLLALESAQSLICSKNGKLETLGTKKEGQKLYKAILDTLNKMNINTIVIKIY
jgi:hypothetical protein